MDFGECIKCKETGIVKEPNGEVHVCWDCLRKGKLDVHTKNLPEPRIDTD